MNETKIMDKSVEQNFYGTGATYEQAVNALGTVVSEWDIHDTTTHKRKMIEKLITNPEDIYVTEVWEDKLKEFNCDRSCNVSHDMKETIFQHLYNVMGDFAKRDRYVGDANLHDQSALYTGVAKHYSDMPDDMKRILTFGYVIEEALSAFNIQPGIAVDGLGDDGSEMLGWAINWTLNNRDFRTGKLIDIDNWYSSEEQAKKHITDNSMDKVETVPLIRDCFMVNIAELLGRPFYVTPDFFELVKLDYEESDKLPYSFCKEWFEKNKDIEFTEDNLLGTDLFGYATCVSDDAILGTREDVSAIDVIDSLAMEVNKYRNKLQQTIEMADIMITNSCRNE